MMPPVVLPKRMTPSEFHEPPTAMFWSSQMLCGAPPRISTFFSFPSVSNAINRLSGDQNGGGELGTCVPSNIRTSSESSIRTQIRCTPSGPAARNASFRPSGDSDTTPLGAKRRLSGTGISKRINPADIGGVG